MRINFLMAVTNFAATQQKMPYNAASGQSGTLSGCGWSPSPVIICPLPIWQNLVELTGIGALTILRHAASKGRVQ
jgi:hypothetical protein